jgi:hypothetical protein
MKEAVPDSGKALTLEEARAAIESKLGRITPVSHTLPWEITRDRDSGALRVAVKVHTSGDFFALLMASALDLAPPAGAPPDDVAHASGRVELWDEVRRSSGIRLRLGGGGGGSGGTGGEVSLELPWDDAARPRLEMARARWTAADCERAARVVLMAAAPRAPGGAVERLVGDGLLPPPPSRTKWTRLVHPSVLIGHVSSL